MTRAEITALGPLLVECRQQGRQHVVQALSLTRVAADAMHREIKEELSEQYPDLDAEQIEAMFYGYLNGIDRALAVAQQTRVLLNEEQAEAQLNALLTKLR